MIMKKNYEVTDDEGIKVKVSDEIDAFTVGKGKHVMLDGSEAEKHKGKIRELKPEPSKYGAPEKAAPKKQTAAQKKKAEADAIKKAENDKKAAAE